jgi:hypothetical protein
VNRSAKSTPPYAATMLITASPEISGVSSKYIGSWSVTGAGWNERLESNDRFITVISGTSWVGTGTKLYPEATVPMPAGSFVTHFGKQVHCDGAKDGDTVLEIVGEGPVTSTPAEQK